MTVRRIDLGPFIEAARLLYDDALVAQRYDAVGGFPRRSGLRSDGGYRSDCRRNHRRGEPVQRGRPVEARRRLTELRDQAMRIWGDADALLVPTAPLHPTIAQVAADPVGVNSRMGTYTNFCNLFDLCGVAVPAGTVDEADGTAAEFGITFLGKRRADAVVLDLARRFVDPELTGPTWVESAATHTELAVFGGTHARRSAGARAGRTGCSVDPRSHNRAVLSARCTGHGSAQTRLDPRSGTGPSHRRADMDPPLHLASFWPPCPSR